MRPVTSIDGERYQRAVELFARACDLPEAERDGFLRGATSGDDALFALARSILANDTSPGDPLEGAASGLSEALGDSDGAGAEILATPERIGAFAIRATIGEGGMGIVYEAEQENPRRIVALKVVRPGMTTPNNLRRFELEAEALARLEHPAIARIYDAGMADTPWGRVPYFAMERVQGRPIAAHCAERALGRRERIALLAKVCDAIEYAHGKGVIHRDLKSSNVLIDDQGNPKVLDFGVARLAERGEEARTELTIEGQIVGTLSTMSPEQVRGDLHRIDARSDVYALGAMAYELLAGNPPLRLEGKPLAEAARIVEEIDPPHLSTIDPACRGDLDVIVGKALEKDPERRYLSASALAADFTRYLRDEPILARPPSAATLLWKFARRNRTPVAAGIVGIGALAIGASVAIWKAIDATRQREFAASRKTEAEASERSARRQAYRANLAAAMVALQVHDVAESKRRLDDAPEELRGWEWEHIRSRLDESLLTFDAPGASSSFDIAPDGRTVVTSLANGTLVAWSLETGTTLGSAALPGGRRDFLAIRPDGRQVLVASFKGGVQFSAFSLPQLSETPLWTSPLKWVGSGCIDAKFEYLLRVDYPPKIRIRDASSGSVKSEIPTRATDTYLALSPAGDLIAFADPLGFGILRLSDGSTVFRRDDLGACRTIAFRGDGARVIVGMFGPVAHVCDATTGASLFAVAGHGAGVTDARFSPDQRTIATSSRDGAVRLWDAQLGMPLKSWHGHSGGVATLRFTPDGGRVVTAGAGGQKVWSAAEDWDPFVLRHPQTVYGLAFSPDGSRLLTGCLEPRAESLFLWDVETGTRIASWLEGPVTSVAWSSDGARLAVGRYTRLISILDAETGLQSATASLHFYNTDSIAYDPALDQWVSSGLNGVLNFDDAKTGKAIQSERVGSPRDVPTPVYRAVVGGNGAWVAATRDTHTISIYEGPERKERLRLLGHEGFVTALGASRDGTLLASGSDLGEIRVWQVSDGKPIATLLAHAQEVFALVFSPDGSRLVSGGRDRTIRVWDTDRWEEVVRLGGHTSFVYALAFSPDGRVLASAGGDDTVRLWDIRTRGQCAIARGERDRIREKVVPLVEEAFAGDPDPKAAIARLRAAAGLDARAREVALQEAFRRCVESRPASRPASGPASQPASQPAPR